MTKLAMPAPPGVLLPKGQATAFKAEQARQRANLTSDEFVTPSQIKEQVSRFRKDYADGGYPHPVGWRLSVLMLTTPDQTDGGLFMLDEEAERRQIQSPQGVVVEVSPHAYSAASKDDARFDKGPWVKVGDRVLFVRYGTRPFRLANGQVIAMFNDTDVLGVIDGGWMDD